MLEFQSLCETPVRLLLELSDDIIWLWTAMVKGDREYGPSIKRAWVSSQLPQKKANLRKSKRKRSHALFVLALQCNPEWSNNLVLFRLAGVRFVFQSVIPKAKQMDRERKKIRWGEQWWGGRKKNMTCKIMQEENGKVKWKVWNMCQVIKF